ncbi:S1-like domain-containing RNA-binding protein [Cohnella lubricantis]|uniref:RNA-binding protein n=1 Tax=Cohnella lubricantis TaxID=2163172 RepID=A0A841T959_9BACL|nr:S1-like domain-containing RNA-binding protein [Cohnella lubricantis]MBB6675780.1 RNA-binding protein [Cohnella lubricantis]MBP2119855.1 putative RNA-binding protein (virulence factor B family) [Cohnella lubricantis]
MSLVAGTMAELRVNREKSPFGYFLGEWDAEEGPEVLLPYGETEGARYEVGVDVEVFLFHDDKGRLTATRKRPLLTLGELGRLQMADFHPRFGCFLEIGISRQLLLPVKELGLRHDIWPKPGDELHVIMKHDKEGRMLARLARIEDLQPLVFRAPSSWHHEEKDAWVTDAFRDGYFVLVEGGVLGFGALGYIPNAGASRPLRIGEKVRGRVTQVRKDGRVTLSMRPAKEKGRLEDADRLLAFLRERPGGAMPYSDESPADVIQRRFEMSKSAFKRAVGKLMKEGLVTQEGSWTKLTETGTAAGGEAASGEGDSRRD